MAVPVTVLPSASVIVMATLLPGATSVVIPDRSRVLAPLSMLSMVTVRSPVTASRVPDAVSSTVFPLRSVAVASTVRVPSTRLDTSTPVRV